jgi:tetratricopeptide (TPR) repeat protein
MTASDLVTEDSQRDARLGEAKKRLSESRFADARDLAAEVLAADSDDTDALYIRAASLRYLDMLEDAQSDIGRLIALVPEYGRAHQERGHLMVAAGRTDEALAAYRHAVQLNPALTASWRAIAKAGASDGTQAEAQAERLEKLPRALLAASNHLHEGRLLKAEDLCRRFLRQHPTHVEGMRLLAEIGVRLSVLDDAEFLLRSARDLEPDNIQVRLDFIGVLRKRQKYEEALSEAQELFERDPDNPVFQSHLAIEAMQVGDYERALQLFDRVLDRVPGDPATLTSRGHALKTYGRQDEAVASYRAAIEAAPSHADAYYALANLKTYRFTDEEIAAMTAQSSLPGLSLHHRIHFEFALGKAFEDREQYAESFAHYDEGNRLKRHQTRYRAEQMDDEFEAMRRAAPRELFEGREGQGHGAPDPIFIVGLPRAGSTLLEQILASHSQVDGTLELPNIPALAHRLRNKARAGTKGVYPHNLAELDDGQLEQLGREYIETTRIHRQGAPFFIDKMPNNFRHIGLIHLILPNAKIIDARREPMACCFSGYKQLFAEGQEFTYGLEEIGRYYRGYVDLMAHWDAVLPGRVLRVQYEDVVDDLEGQVRRVLDHCGLPFEEACIRFHETRRSVRTASSEQVRQPIYRAGVDQWRAFAPNLEPLRKALGPALHGYRT